MKVLHKFNPVRLAYIRDEACRRFGRDPRSARSLDGLTILDVGCGGGVLSEPLARLGATVTGLDPAPTNISVARLHAERAGLRVDYRNETVEAVVAAGRDLRHGARHGGGGACGRRAGLRECLRQGVKPERLPRHGDDQPDPALLRLAIVGAEYMLGWLPKGTHEWDKFVTPDELSDAIRGGGLECRPT